MVGGIVAGATDAARGGGLAVAARRPRRSEGPKTSTIGIRGAASPSASPDGAGFLAPARTVLAATGLRDGDDGFLPPDMGPIIMPD